MNSMPAGASHRIRVWLKTFLPFPSNENDHSSNISLPFNDSYVYQRIWKSDSLKLGARLDFFTLGSKMVMGYSNGPPKTYTVSQTRDKYETKGALELGWYTPSPSAILLLWFLSLDIVQCMIVSDLVQSFSTLPVLRQCIIIVQQLCTTQSFLMPNIIHTLQQ